MLKSNIYLWYKWRHLVLRNLFTAHTYLELQQNEEALQLYFGLMNAGLQDSSYILAQVAVALHNMRQVRFTSCNTLSNETKFKSVLHFVLVCTLNVTSCLSKMRVVNLRHHWMSERDCKRNFNWPCMQKEYNARFTTTPLKLLTIRVERSLCLNINPLKRSLYTMYTMYRVPSAKLICYLLKVSTDYVKSCFQTFQSKFYFLPPRS